MKLGLRDVRGRTVWFQPRHWLLMFRAIRGMRAHGQRYRIIVRIR